MTTIVIDPVTRIEGHAKITIHLDDDGNVVDTAFHVTQLRGFEKFCEGRPFYEMPSITARICGICPISHLLTSAKACEAIMSVRIPPTAAKLREIMHCGQVIQSHALSFFHLSAPDLLLGFDSDPARRNLVGVIEDHPQLAKDGIALRKIRSASHRRARRRAHPSVVDRARRRQRAVGPRSPRPHPDRFAGGEGSGIAHSGVLQGRGRPVQR